GGGAGCRAPTLRFTAQATVSPRARRATDCPNRRTHLLQFVSISTPRFRTSGSAPGRRISRPRLIPMDAELLPAFGDRVARIVHPGLHGVARDPQDLDQIVDGLPAVVDEIDDLAMDRRDLVEAACDHCALLGLLERDFRIVALILDPSRNPVIERLHLPPPEHLQRQIASDAQQPGRDLRPALEAPSAAPYFEENLADDVFGRRLLVYETERIPIHA